MPKKTHGLAAKITIKDTFTGKDLYLTRAEALRGLARAKKEKQKIATQWKKLTGSRMKGVPERSLFELQNVLRYQREITLKRK